MAVAVLADVAPLLVVLALAMRTGADDWLPGSWRDQPFVDQALFDVVDGFLLVVVLSAILAHLNPWTPRGTTLGEWMAGLHAAPDSTATAPVRWLKRLMVFGVPSLVLFGPLARLLMHAGFSEYAAAVVSVLPCFFVVSLPFTMLVRFIRRGRDSRGRRLVGPVVEDRFALRSERSPEPLVAAIILLAFLLCTLAWSLDAMGASLPIHVGLALRVGGLGSLLAALFGTLALLVAGRDRARRDGRAFPLSDLGLVVGFLLPPYTIAHVFRVAITFLDAYPEARTRPAPMRPAVAPFVMLAATGVAACCVTQCYLAAAQLGLAPAAGPALASALFAVPVALTCLPLAVALFRVREVLARVHARPAIEGVRATFE